MGSDLLGGREAGAEGRDRQVDPETIAYVQRRTAEGLSKKEIIRCLKRYVARELFALLPDTSARNHLALVA